MSPGPSQQNHPNECITSTPICQDGREKSRSDTSEMTSFQACPSLGEADSELATPRTAPSSWVGVTARHHLTAAARVPAECASSQGGCLTDGRGPARWLPAGPPACCGNGAEDLPHAALLSAINSFFPSPASALVGDCGQRSLSVHTANTGQTSGGYLQGQGLFPASVNHL